MPVTLAQAQTALSNWLAADVAVSSGQEYSLAGRSFTRVDAEQIRENINYWSRIEASLLRIDNGEGKISFAVANVTK